MTAIVGPALGVIGGAVGGLVSKVLGKTKKAAAASAPMPLPTAQVRTRSLVSDALARRRGSSANMRTGSGGAESRAGPKKQLMGQ